MAARGYVLFVLVMNVYVPHAHGVTLFESTPFNDEFARFGGTGVDATQFLGHRFHLDTPASIERVGVTLSNFEDVPFGNEKVFAAIVALADAGDFPDSTDLSTPDLVGAALIDVATGEIGVESVADLELDLAPGWYAIVAGSGLFGATGRAAASFVPFVDRPDPISLSFPSFDGWENVEMFASANGTPLTSRMFVEGDFIETAPVPEPLAGLCGMLAVLVLGYFVRRRRGLTVE